MPPHPPSSIKTLLHSLFIKENAYGQLTTVNQKHQPSIRTVHFQMPASMGFIWINTHTDSEKWSDIKHLPHVAGCYWAKGHRVQIRFKAHAILIGPRADCTPQQQAILSRMWGSMRPEVRLAYLMADQGIPLHQGSDPQPPIDTNLHSPCHGLLECAPYRWDVFYESPKAYRLGRRDIYELKDDQTWTKKTLSSLHEQPVVL